MTTLARAATMLNPEQAAAYLGLAKKSLANWRVKGDGPPFHRVGVAIRYRIADLDAWLDGRRYRSTAEADAADHAA